MEIPDPTESDVPSTHPSRGRPRDARTQAAILRATRELLLERDYRRLTIEGVATRAGAAKSTIYRWWPNKARLVLDAAGAHLAIGTVPDTGSTEQDLRAAIEQLTQTFSDPLASVVILAAIARVDDDPVLAVTFRDKWVYPWRASAVEALERAIARGDLPGDTDPTFTLDVIVGTVFQRTIVVAEPMVDGLADELVALVARHAA